ncbi:FtsX-like permease family protein [Actinacidiphila sp. bgisy160]|uniref:FtsX-like permease family protein n=1 Tax=Actinacidiphila sp. bgisy160 TaxID=3413796 RepID=UPI003D70C12C
MRGLRGDALLAWALLRGSPRSQWWRLALTALGAALGTGFALAAVVVAVINTRFGGGEHRYTNDLLNEAGLRPGVVAALLLLLVPVLAFVGQCTRIGALRRERRLAALRLAGATPSQVRRISALETGAACGLGSLAGLAGFLTLRAVLDAGAPAMAADGGAFRLLTWPTDVPVPWPAAILVVPGLPLLATAEAWFTLRRAAVDPLGPAARRPRRTRTGPGMWLLGPVALIAGIGLVLLGLTVRLRHVPIVPIVVAILALCAVGLVYTSAGLALFTGRLAARSGRPALLIAGERLRADPWASARAHTVVMLASLVGVGWVVMRRVTVEMFRNGPDYAGGDVSFYVGGYDLAGLALLIGVSVTVSGLAVGVVESLMTRRRALAALAAAGTPRKVLWRATLLETALPLVPALLLGAGCGLALVAPVVLHGQGRPLPLLEPALLTGGLLAASLLATAAGLPLLRRTVHPAQLRHE